MKKCIVCNKEFKEIRSNQKYCSHKCMDHVYYLKHKKQIKDKVREWEINNPIRKKINDKKAIQKLVDQGYFKKAMKKYYLKNKDKHDSRNHTLNIINAKGYNPIELPKDFYQCKDCGSKENLQIHHEIYPKSKKEITDAINNNKIYYMCKICHKKAHPHS